MRPHALNAAGKPEQQRYFRQFSCESTPFSKLVISSLGAAYISSFTIHSCATVFVANDSFAGAVLSDRLEFSGIGRLMLEPHAFRNIVQSPKQLVVDKCSLPVLLPYTFTGLSHMEHLWFRNSTIERLSTHTFYHLTHVNYLYFRDVTFKVIEKKAFGKMYSIGHLFLGGAIRIESGDGWLFAESSIEEILLEGVVGRLEEAFLLNTLIHLATIKDSVLQIESFEEVLADPEHLSSSTSSPQQNSVHFRNVTMSFLVPGLLTHFNEVLLSNCSIQTVRANRRTTMISKMNTLTLSETNVAVIEPFGFANISTRDLIMANCTVGKIGFSAFAGCRLDTLRIYGSRIASMSEGLLRNAYSKRIRITETNIEEVAPLAFDGASIGEMEMDSCLLHTVENHAFKGGHIRTLILRKTTANNVKPMPFAAAKIYAVQMTGCSMRGSPVRELFSGLSSNHLKVVNSTFDCEPSDCEMNSLLLNPPRHELLWTFDGNSCRTALGPTMKALCTRPNVQHYSGLTCRLSFSIADCVCTGSSAVLPMLNASIIIVGDCENLKVNSSAGVTQALYLFRIGRCEVISMPSTIEVWKVYHTNIFIHKGAIVSNHFSTVSLLHTQVDKIAQKGVINVTADELIVGNSSLMNFHPEAIQRSKIETATIAETKLKVVTSLLRAVRQLSVSNSVLFSTEGLSTVKDVHLSNNTVLCCCDSPETRCSVNAVMRRKCAEHWDDLSCAPSNHAIRSIPMGVFIATCLQQLRIIVD
ncbi:hypothetical protein Q1695_015257 [Nippostrongylus brasiliensis]|nr:hypothetical protein Q1695_015257 [Nippostrongylus brasiliensis]